MTDPFTPFWTRFESIGLDADVYASFDFSHLATALAARGLAFQVPAPLPPAPAITDRTTSQRDLDALLADLQNYFHSSDPPRR
jgi:hypothetical protein